jgi:hypothetical protein
MSDPNVHPNISFRILGYRGTKQDSLHIYPDGSFEHVKQSHPIGSEHAHLPPPPCRYQIVFTGPRDMLEERRQQFCRECARHAGEVVDNRKLAIA